MTRLYDKIQSLFIALLFIVSLSSCENDDENFQSNIQFQNYSFDQAGISPWKNVFDSTLGQPWEYDGKYSQSVFVRGFGIKTHSQILMQGDFPAGTYRVQIQVDNQNEVEDMEENGILKIKSIDQYGTWEHASVVLDYTIFYPDINH